MDELACQESARFAESFQLDWVVRLSQRLISWVNASAANGNLAGSGIVVQTGSGAHTIASNIILADSQTWTNNSANPLTVSGTIGDGGHHLSLTIAGAGPIVLRGNASYCGTTTVINGTLATTSTGTIGTGPLTVSSTESSSVVNLGGMQSVGTLSGLVSSGGSGHGITSERRRGCKQVILILRPVMYRDPDTPTGTRLPSRFA